MSDRDQFIDPAGYPIAGTESPAQGGEYPAGIHRCQVIEVDSEKWTLHARQEESPYSIFMDVPWAVPYCNQTMGEGMNYMPEPGATCYLAKPSGSQHAVVFAWVMLDEGGSYRGGRPELSPGDYAFTTRDGNFLYIRRGGIVQIGSTSLAQFVFLPIGNVIQGIFENLRMTGVPGDLLWEVARSEEDTDGHRRCTLTLNAREYADDPKDGPLVQLKLGSLSDGGSTVLSLQTRDKGNGTVTHTLTIDKSGAVAWRVGALTINAKSLDVVVDGVANVKASAINLGDATDYAMLASVSFTSWIAKVTAVASIFDPTILAPPLVKSTKVKV